MSQTEMAYILQRLQRIEQAIEHLTSVIERMPRPTVKREPMGEFTPTRSNLRDLFRYDPIQKTLMWLKGHQAGKPIGGSLDQRDEEGYPVASVKQTRYRIASLVYCFFTDEWHDNLIHVDGNVTNFDRDNLTPPL